MSKHIDFGFKRLRVTDTGPASLGIFRLSAEPTMKSLYYCQYLSTPTTKYGGADLHLHGVHQVHHFPPHISFYSKPKFNSILEETISFNVTS